MPLLSPFISRIMKPKLCTMDWSGLYLPLGHLPHLSPRPSISCTKHNLPHLKAFVLFLQESQYSIPQFLQDHSLTLFVPYLCHLFRKYIAWFWPPYLYFSSNTLHTLSYLFSFKIIFTTLYTDLLFYSCLSPYYHTNSTGQEFFSILLAIQALISDTW